LSCEARNKQLVKVGQDMLAGYRDLTLGDVIAIKDPVIGIARVDHQNRTQDFRDRILDNDAKLPVVEQQDSKEQKPAQNSKDQKPADKKNATRQADRKNNSKKAEPKSEPASGEAKSGTSEVAKDGTKQQEEAGQAGTNKDEIKN
jgi:hypothetical protein